MSSSIVKPSHALASAVWFDASMLHGRLDDGREISAPIEWFQRLRDAGDKERVNWRLIGEGVGIHWEDLDEDLSVAGLLKA